MNFQLSFPKMLELTVISFFGFLSADVATGPFAGFPGTGSQPTDREK